jgi:hypothetical protein
MALSEISAMVNLCPMHEGLQLSVPINSSSAAAT